MPILFSAIAYHKNILSKFASCDGNFMEIVEELLSRISPKNEKMTYSHGHYLFHYIADSEYFFFCITDKMCQRSRAFLFLKEISRRFKPSIKEFNHVLAEEMYRYSEDYSTITIRKGDLEELNSIGVGCSESVLGEKILFVNNPEDLTFSTISCVVGEIPQQVLISTKENSEVSQNLAFNFAGEISQPTIYSDRDNPDKLMFSTTSYLHNNSHENEPKITNNIKFYFIVITVILVFMWLAISLFGTVSFVILAGIFVLSFRRLSKLKNNSKDIN